MRAYWIPRWVRVPFRGKSIPMNRTGRTLALGCLLLLQPLLAHAQAGGNSLLIPAMGRCTLNTQPQDVTQALAACQKAADEGDAQAQYELGEFYYYGKNQQNQGGQSGGQQGGQGGQRQGGQDR